MLVIAPMLVLGPYIADRQLGGAPAWSAIGMALAGPAAAAFGTAPVLVAVAAATVLITAVTLPAPSVWRIRGEGRQATASRRTSPGEPPSNVEYGSRRHGETS
ncbi:hypothetical protein [Nonomuraea sp. NPDC049480]|uniref:hypothetical protein n=1 Tax=Nonomuraea sp. NPDC049480 TaxID=3364353 RepID=UPI0037BD30A0